MAEYGQLPPGYQYNRYTGMVERIPYVPTPDYSQFAQRQNCAMIPGRYISNPAEVKANEVPMDGSVSFFPTQDYNYIYAKAWNAEGKIQTEVYQRVVHQNQSEQSVETDILERLDRIEKMLNQKNQRKKELTPDVS